MPKMLESNPPISKKFSLSLVLVLLAILVAAGCSTKGQNYRRIVLNGTAYEFTDANITAYIPSEDASDQPKGAARVMFDEFKLEHVASNYNPSPLGSVIPNVFSISSLHGHKVILLNINDTDIVCKDLPKNIHYHYDCGIAYKDGQVIWSIVLDRDNLSNISSIVREASNALNQAKLKS